MQLRAAPAFDFDEWAELYRTDPAAFEARRKALLSIEIAKGGPIAAPAAAVLAALEDKSADASPMERMTYAAKAMLDSSRMLQAQLQRLAREVEVVARPSTPPESGKPKASALPALPALLRLPTTPGPTRVAPGRPFD